MKHHFRFAAHHHRPHWWPENEPWPPERPYWRSGRARFFRRIGCLLFVFVVLAIVLLALALSALAHSLGLVPLFRDSAHWLIVAIAFVFIFGIGFVAWAVRGLRRLSTPFGDLLDAAGHVAEGDYSARVSEQGPREVRSLAHAFNTMATRLQAHDRQRRNLLADVTHELRTPLTVIQGNLEGMLDGVYPADEAQLRLLMEETNILSRLVDDLRVLALAESGSLELRREPTDLAMLIRDTLSAFGAQAAALGVTLDFQAQEGPTLDVDPERIRQVLANLVANALRYTPRQGAVTVRCDMENAEDGRVCVVTVTDSGPGVAEDELAHIFERFHKSGDSGGMGLGLSIAKSLVEAHGGRIEAHSRPGQGTSMRFMLPVQNADSVL